MKRFISASAVVAIIAFPAILQTTALGQISAGNGVEDPRRAMVNTYCVTCHNARLRTGGLALDGLDLARAPNDAQIWEKALRKLRGHQMPPPGSPQPSQKDADSFVAWMENTLDTHPKGPHSGYVPIQRLNRAEYAATVKALVGVEVNAKEVLPQDIQVDGFDNIATALSVSPAFLDQYVTAARQVARLAVGSPNPRVSSVKYSIAANQNPEIPLPPGTRGGIRFKHNFPADGEYRITINDLAVGPYTAALENASTVVIMIDGRIVFRRAIGGREDQALADRKAGDGRAQIMARFSKIPVQVKAGVRDVVVAFVDRSHVLSDENFDKLEEYNGLTGSQAPMDRIAHLRDGVEVAGPFNPTGVSRTPSRDLIFVCDPETREQESSGRSQVTARRAFRRPVTEGVAPDAVPDGTSGRRNLRPGNRASRGCGAGQPPVPLSGDSRA